MSKTSRNARRRAAKQRTAQEVQRVLGQGGYYTENILPALRKMFPDGTFSRAGAKAGGLVGRLGAGAVAPPLAGAGAGIGSKLGSKLGAGLARLVGFGDYEVANNSLARFGGIIPPGEAIPSFGVMGSSTRVRHREYLGDITVPSSPTAFKLTTYTVNPGDGFTFPWLSALAVQYQQYKFDGLIFEFRTLASDITSGGALGAVVMASNYDVVQPAFANKIQMENSQYAVSTKPSCSMIHTMECAPGQVANNLYYVRNSGPVTASGTDNRMYDLANFQIATQGLPGSSGQVLGELWVSYDVQLFKPIINEATVGASFASLSPTKNSIFGSTVLMEGAFNAQNNTITFTQPGEYLVYFACTGTGLIPATLSGTAPGITQVASTYNASSTEVSVSIAVQVTAPNQTLVLDFSGSTSVATGQSLISDFSYSLA